MVFVVWNMLSAPCAKMQTSCLNSNLTANSDCKHIIVLWVKTKVCCGAVFALSTPALQLKLNWKQVSSLPDYRFYHLFPEMFNQTAYFCHDGWQINEAFQEVLCHQDESDPLLSRDISKVHNRQVKVTRCRHNKNKVHLVLLQTGPLLFWLSLWQNPIFRQL